MNRYVAIIALLLAGMGGFFVGHRLGFQDGYHDVARKLSQWELDLLKRKGRLDL